ncbi:MAG TPA: hypothetical protein VID48_07605 [Solirubrobacteraceae bacterium]
MEIIGECWRIFPDGLRPTRIIDASKKPTTAPTPPPTSTGVSHAKISEAMLLPRHCAKVCVATCPWIPM